jgi:CheY-like chemotaxis protein
VASLLATGVLLLQRVATLTPTGVVVNKSKTSAPARVLLVDDEHRQSELRALILTMAGFSVLLADGPIEALSLATTIQELDVAIVDYEMPMMNGAALAEHLKARFPNINIILYSACVGIPSRDLQYVDTFIPKEEGVTALLNHLWNKSPQVTDSRRPADATAQYDNPELPPGDVGRAESSFLSAAFAATKM